MQKTFENFDWDNLLTKLPVKNNEEERAKRKEIFKKIDNNGNGFVSLAEMDKGIRDFLLLPEVFECKQPIMRAFQAAKIKHKSKSKHGDDYIEWLEFRFFLIYLRQYFEYFVMFCRLDKSGDKKINLNEFKSAMPTLEKWGVKVSDAKAEFDKIDTNKGGVVLFDEFCEYAIKKSLDLEDDDDFDAK